MRLLKQLLPVGVVSVVGGLCVSAVQGNPFLALLFGAVVAVLAVLTYAKVVRWSERRAPVEVAGEDARAGLGRGTLLG
ncbi:CPBP family intramembrane glutamate endopeptidase, partial [Actinomadura adrarensis]